MAKTGFILSDFSLPHSQSSRFGWATALKWLLLTCIYIRLQTQASVLGIVPLFIAQLFDASRWVALVQSFMPGIASVGRTWTSPTD